MEPISISGVETLVKGAWEKMQELMDPSVPEADRRLALAKEVQVIGETLDDLPARFLPMGFRELYLMAVDSPAADEWENVNLWLPVSDFIYNLLRIGTSWIQQAIITVEQLLAEVVNRVFSLVGKPLPA